VGALFKLIRFQSDNWVVSSLISLLLLLCLVITVWIGLCVGLITVLTLKTLLHTNNSFLAQRLGWVLNSELFTLLRAEIVRDKVISDLHLVQNVQLFVDSLLLVGSINLLLLGWCRQGLLDFSVHGNHLFLLVGNLKATLGLVEGAEIALTELLNGSAFFEFLHGLHLECRGFKLRFGGSTVLKDLNADTLVESFVILNLFPVDLGVLRWRKVHNTELSLVPDVVHSPVQVALVISCECLLVESVTIRHLENLREKELLLVRNEQVNIWHVEFTLESVTSIVGEFNIVQKLLLKLHLLHINNLS